MISYEKVRQSLRSWTLIIAWLNVVAIPVKCFSIFSFFLLRNNLDTLKTTYNAETYKAVVASTHIGNFLLIILGIIANVLISFLAFKNLAKIKEDTPTQLPYLIGIGYTIIANLISIVLNSSLGVTLSIYSFLTPLVFLALYGYAYYQANKLLDKDEESNEES